MSETYIPLDSGLLESEDLQAAYPNQPYASPRKGDFQAAAADLNVPGVAKRASSRHKRSAHHSRKGRHHSKGSHHKATTHHRLRSTGGKTRHGRSSSGHSHSKKHPGTHHKPHKAHVTTVATPTGSHH